MPVQKHWLNFLIFFSLHFVSFRFDRFRFVLFGFASFLFRFALYRYPFLICINAFITEYIVPESIIRPVVSVSRFVRSIQRHFLRPTISLILSTSQHRVKYSNIIKSHRTVRIATYNKPKAWDWFNCSIEMCYCVWCVTVPFE
jgi:hypothetical protein